MFALSSFGIETSQIDTQLAGQYLDNSVEIGLILCATRNAL